MLDFDAAVGAADRAAGAVWRAAQGPNSFGWRDALTVRVPLYLAQFVAGNRAANAAQLYRFAIASDPAAKPFDRVPPALRVSMETFRATFLVLLEEIERAAAVAVLLPPVEPAAARSLVGPSDAHTPSGPWIRPAPRELDSSIRRIEETWTRDSGRPAKRQRKEVRP